MFLETVEHVNANPPDGRTTGRVPYWFGWALSEAFTAGIHAERAACAKVADGWANQDYFAKGIAAAIRARGEVKP